MTVRNGQKAWLCLAIPVNHEVVEVTLVGPTAKEAAAAYFSRENAESPRSLIYNSLCQIYQMKLFKVAYDMYI